MGEQRIIRTLWNGEMEVRVFAINAEPEGRALVFETDLGRRYAFVFPVEWEQLSDAALLAIASRAPD
jgi:hypothetical protein